MKNKYDDYYRNENYGSPYGNDDSDYFMNYHAEYRRRAERRQTVYKRIFTVIAAILVLSFIVTESSRGSSKKQNNNYNYQEYSTPAPDYNAAIPTPEVNTNYTETPASEAEYASYDAAGCKTEFGARFYDGADYTAEQKVGFCGDAYYSRKDSSGEYRDGYNSRRIPNELPNGYTISAYYADGLTYYVEINDGGNYIAKLYYWGGTIVGVRDYRGSNHELQYSGSVFDNAVYEFSAVYDVTQRYA